MGRVTEFPDRRIVEREAAEWLVRLDGDEPLSPAEVEDLRQWSQRSPVHRKELADLAELWGRMNVLTELAVPLGRVGEGGAAQVSRRALPVWRHPVLAAAATMLLGVGLWVGLSRGPEISPNGIYSTAVGEQRILHLQDGSTVQLNTNSRMQVALSADRRDIQLLQGEASFEVAKDRARPFIVSAGSSQVRAVGTVFVVYKRDRDIQVTVTEGKVELAATESAAPAAKVQPLRLPKVIGTLEAGQSATIAEASELPPIGEAAPEPVAEIQSIDEQQLKTMLSWRQGLVIFRGEPLQDVVAEISRYTPLDIEIADPSVAATRIGGQFRVGDTDTLFDVLQANFGLRVVELGDNRVRVTSAGQH